MASVDIAASGEQQQSAEARLLPKILKKRQVREQKSDSIFLRNVRDSIRQKILKVKQAQDFIRVSMQAANERKAQTGRNIPFPVVGSEGRRWKPVDDDIKPLRAFDGSAGRRLKNKRESLQLPELYNSNRGSLAGSTGIGEPLTKLRSRKPRRPELGRKFKAAAWISIIIRRLCLANLRNTEDSDSPYMKNIKFVDSMVKENQGNLLFSVKEFKANREMRMSEVSKHILNKPRWARSDQELLHVEIGLRTIKDYADYPVAIQRKIAEVGEYVKYESRRIIVREGHPAWNFYFILSGSVVVLVMDEERSFVKPKAVLVRGQSFGELAIINNDRRRSTIVAMEETEMLSLWYEDYQEIFMDGGTSKADDEFITNLDFLQGWPIEIADKHPELFRYHFYKRGEVVIRDSVRSKWIIVVKSGSLQVLKRLKKVQPFEWRNKSSNDKELGGTSLSPAMQSQLNQVVSHNKPTDRNNSVLDNNKRTSAGLTRTSTSIDISLKNIKDIGTLSVETIKQDILTAASELDREYSQLQLQSPADTEQHTEPMFVRIQNLTEGQVFGLCDIVLGEQPSFCVVSNGAEVILIDKEFYTDHVTDQTLKDIRTEAQAYPSDEELQDSLQSAVDWVAYKEMAIKSAIGHSNRNQAKATNAR